VQNVWITFSVATGPTFSPAPTADGTNDGSQCRSNPNGECSVRMRSAVPGDFLVSEIAPIATNPIAPQTATFCDPASDPNCHSYVPNETTSTFVIDPDNQPANGASEDGVAITLFDKDLHVVPNARVFLTVGSGARLTSTFCDTDANGVCLDDTNHKTGVTSLVAGEYTVVATPQMPNPWDKVAVAHFCDPTNPATTTCDSGPPVTENSTLVVTKDRQLANGIAQDMVRATLADKDKRPVKNARVAFDVQPSARLVNIVCMTGDGTNGTAGACDDGITSHVVGQYKVSVTEPIPTTPPEVTVTFINGTVIPDCTASTKQAPPNQTVTVTCKNGTPGDKVVIPGTSCSPATLSPTGDLTCVGNSSDMGDNPPIVVTNPETGTNTGVLDFQVIDDGSNSPLPPPVPNCVAYPNPALSSQTVTLTCTNGVPADIVRIAGTDCNPAAIPPTGVLVCEGTARVIGSNPVVTVTDPSSGLSNSSIVPLEVYSIADPSLPDCVASPNPAKPGEQVIVSCENGQSGTEVTIPGTDCNATLVPSSGSLICKGDAGDMGSNPPIKVVDPDTGGESDGIIPLEVDSSANPPLPDCKASPNPAQPSDQVTATCNNGKPGTTITIPGTDCTNKLIPSSGTVLCTGIANDMGSNPPITVVDPGTGGSSKGVLPLEVLTTTTEYPKLPDCVANPNPAKSSDQVAVTCENGQAGTEVTIPGTDCTSAVVPPSGSLTCKGNAGDMGTNPPIKVIDPTTGGESDGVIPLQVDSSTNPPLPNCKASPNPAQPSDQVAATCNNGKPGTTITIPGTDCSSQLIPSSGTVICTGIARDMGSNPPVIVVDPGTGGSSTGVLPLKVLTNTPPPRLPDCVASPNPTQSGVQVTVTCGNGQPGTEVTIRGTDCNAAVVPSSGSLTCKGDAGNMGNNPPIKVIDPTTGGESDGVIPLQVDTSANPPLPNCTADPREALSSDQVTATCNNGKPGTTITIPGTDCTNKLIPSSGSVVCTGNAGDMGSNPPITVVDPGTGGSSKGVLPLDVVTKPVYPKLPDCVADPNPVAPGQPVTISCQNGQPGTEVTIPNTDCITTKVPGSGVLVCKATDSSTLGNNPPLIVTDPATDVTSEGTIPLVVQPLATPSEALSVLNIMDNNRPADGVAQDTAEVLLLDTNGNPITNTVVTFAAASGATLVSETCRTSAYGGCLVGLTAIVPGDYAVKVIAPVKLGPVQATFVGEISRANSTLFMDVNNQPANGVSEDRAQVTLRDRNNNPVGGTTVTFSVTSGALFTSNGQLNAVKRATPGAPAPVTPSAQVTCTTDKLGMCTVGLTSSVPGSYDVSTTAPVTLGPVSALFVQPIPGAPDAAHSSLVISVDGATANGLSQDIATVTLHDASDMAVPNVVVAFTVDAGATLVDAACRTDADGICTVGLTSTTAGQYGVTAQAGTLTLGPKTATFIAVCTATVTTNCGPAAPDAGKSKIEVLPPNNAQANGRDQDTVQVTLHDANDQPVSSAQVTLRSGVGSTLISTTCLTDVKGICTVGITSTTAGAYLVETTAPVAMGPVAARFVAASPSNTAISTPTLDPRVLLGLMALLTMVALRAMRRGMR
jgi:hypothetical protein